MSDDGAKNFEITHIDDNKKVQKCVAEHQKPCESVATACGQKK
jgi:hypothetical protein